MPCPEASVCNVKVSAREGIVSVTLLARLTLSNPKALSISSVQATTFGAETDVDGVRRADILAYLGINFL